MDQITELIKVSITLKQDKEENQQFLDEMHKDLEALRHLLSQEKELWSPEFQDMVNPYLGEWNLSNIHVTQIPKTYAWTPEKLSQRIIEKKGIITLDLKDCGLTNIPEVAFDNTHVRKIHILELSGNLIRALPEKLSHFTSLQQLWVCCNEVRTIEEGALGEQLEVLGLAANALTCLPCDVAKCKKLHLMNLSFNNLKVLPPSLPALEVLDVRGNTSLDEHLAEDIATDADTNLTTSTYFQKLKLFSAPACGFKEMPRLILESPSVRYINMQKNRLEAISSGIGNLSALTGLYLNFNKIKELPIELVNCEELQHLEVTNNPLNIPEEVVLQGIQAIMNYLKETKKTEMVSSLHFRVPMLGDTGVGKSSFVDSLIAEKPQLKPEDDRTYVVEHKLWHPESTRYPGKKLQVQFDDFGGHECYKQVHVFFLSRKCTPVICTRGDQLTKETFTNTVIPWLETTGASVPNARFHLLLTHSDRCASNDVVEHKLQMLLEMVKGHEEGVVQQIKQQLETVKANLMTCLDNTTITQLEKQKSDLDRFLEQRPELPMRAHAITTQQIQSIKNVGQEILKVFEDEKKFGEEIIPLAWVNFQKCIQSETRKSIFLPLNTLYQLGQTFRLDQQGVNFALKYFHLCGYILWYDDGPLLKDFVFYEPNKLVAVIKTLITHDIQDFQKSDKRFEILTAPEFAKEQERMLNKGLVSMKLLGCLWSHFNLTQKETNALKELLLRFDLCFALPRAKNVFKADQAEDLMFPWLLPEKRPHFPFDDETPVNQHQLSIKLAFAGISPASFLPALSVRLNKFVKNVKESRQDWNHGTFGEDENGNIFLVEHFMNNCTDTVLLKVRGSILTSMWRLALAIQLDMQDLLNKWPGIIATFVIPCPVCLTGREKPCEFIAEYLWTPYPVGLRPRCQETMEPVDPLLLYPSQEVLEGFVPQKEIKIKRNTSQHGQASELLNVYGAEMLREIFQTAIQPMSLEQWLLSYQPSVHRSLKNRPMAIYGKLYRIGGQTIQITDLNCEALLDLLTGDNVHVPPLMLKIVNEFKALHDEFIAQESGELTDQQLNAVWDKAENIIIRLGGDRKKIERLKQEKHP